MTQPIELILMRELADHLATPIFVVQPDGDLLFYNEPAEQLLGSRFDETGLMPFEEWATAFTPDGPRRDTDPARRSCRSRSLRSNNGPRSDRWRSSGSTASTAG